jgi:RNA polymerase sigma factor, sigma-70 family
MISDAGKRSDPLQPSQAQVEVEILEFGPGAQVDDVPTVAMYSRLEDACAVEYPRIVRLLTLYCGDREVAADLAQEAMARGCAHWQRLRGMRDQRAWFTRVAINLANSRWRRLKVERRASVILRATTTTQESDLAEAVAVRTAVAALTPRQRAAVVLRYFEDLDVAATATVMGCSENTIKKLTARGLTALRARLAFDLVGEGHGHV